MREAVAERPSRVSIWYMIITADGHPFKGATLDKVKLDSTADIADFRQQVKQNNSDDILISISPSKLAVYIQTNCVVKNGTKIFGFDNRQPLEEDVALSDFRFGLTKKDALLVVVPPMILRRSELDDITQLEERLQHVSIVSPIERIPTKLLSKIAGHLPFKSYHEFRRSSKKTFLLDKVPTLTFKAYQESVVIQERQDQLSNNESESKGSLNLMEDLDEKVNFEDGHHIMLMLDDLNDDSIMFIAEHIHSFEFIRCLNSYESHTISKEARVQLLHIMVTGFRGYSMNANENMIICLLNAGNIDPTIRIDPDANSNSRHHYHNLITWAAGKGTEKLVTFLLKNTSIDPTVTDEDGWQAVHCAAWDGKFQNLKVLIEDVRVDQAALGFNHETIIHSASKSGNSNIMSYLLDNTNIHPSCPDDKGVYPIHNACYCDDEFALPVLLRDSRVDINVQTKDGDTPLHIVLKCENYFSLGCLLLRGDLTHRRIDCTKNYC
jgi:Ankyrin repeats (3 copies)